VKFLIVIAYIFVTERIDQAIAFSFDHQGISLYSTKEFGGSKTFAILYKFIVYEDTCRTSC
jgi:hypothetical protein